MIFTATNLNDAYLIDLEKRADGRGFFSRSFCAAEFERAGIAANFVQANLSHNNKRGTLRGMHFQRAPYEEDKLVRCVRGAIYDCIIDLRAASSTYLKSEGFVLTAENGRSLLVPKGFAHGFQTLEDDTDVTYMVSTPYTPQAEGGVRYDDPAFALKWPEPVSSISDKDKLWPDFQLHELEATR